jgi:hypothetical protein
MPETLEERFGRAKSGLMLAPANTQAAEGLLAMDFIYFKMLPASSCSGKRGEIYLC